MTSTLRDPGLSDLDGYRLVATIRRVEELSEELFRSGTVRGALHLCAGQEAVAVGVCAAMERSDYLGYTYRSHGWALARGIPVQEVLAELLGREAGCCGGRGGSKHLGDWSRRILPASSIVAGHLPVMVGCAMAATMAGENAVAVAVFGEGATSQGAFHEALTLAAVRRLPVVFVCENNQYAEMSPAAETLPVAVVERAASHGLHALSCDGMSVGEVTAAAAEALDRARAGQGPVFLEARTYRFSGHMTGDPQTYRSAAEVDRWRERDPLQALRARVGDSSACDGIDREVHDEVDEALQRALNAPEPAPASLAAGTASYMEASR